MPRSCGPGEGLHLQLIRFSKERSRRGGEGRPAACRGAAGRWADTFVL